MPYNDYNVKQTNPQQSLQLYMLMNCWVNRKSWIHEMHSLLFNSPLAKNNNKKSKPLDKYTEGLFVCNLCHYPLLYKFKQDILWLKSAKTTGKPVINWQLAWSCPPVQLTFCGPVPRSEAWTRGACITWRISLLVLWRGCTGEGQSSIRIRNT